MSETLQTDSVSNELRNSIWNTLYDVIWSSRGFIGDRIGEIGHIDIFSKHLWKYYFKLPIDSRPISGHDPGKKVLKSIRDYYFSCQWNEVYDFVEYISTTWGENYPALVNKLNSVLNQEISSYRIIDGYVVSITDEQEQLMLEEALSDTQFHSVTTHLKRALELLADRLNPDYRNSIKESISAVEAIARIIADKPKATLGQALNTIEKNGKLHPSLRDGFNKLYGYTSDEDGIRHAMLDEPILTQADAKYFLLSCTSFINYLKTNHDQNSSAPAHT